MKFLHLGDLHIGRSLHDFSLIEDQKYILNQILDIIKEQSVNAVLIAGDVYDKSIPSEEAVRLFDYFLSKLAGEGIVTFIISGNHDSEERLNFGSSLFETNQLYISAKYRGVLYKKTIDDEHGKLNVYLLPFVKASQVRHFFPDEKIDSYDDAVRVVLGHANINNKERNILVAHQYVIGKNEKPIFGGSESVAVLNVGNVESIKSDCFNDFDYVALGHIHFPQEIDRKEIRYAGSPLKYSLRETNDQKTVPIITFGDKGDVSVEIIKLVPKRNLRHLTGELTYLLDPKNIKGQDDFIYATLTDEEPINEAIRIFRQYYPNTIKLDYDNSHIRGIDQVDISRITKDMSFSDIISEFYSKMYGCDISEEEMALMNEVAREVGVGDETN